MSGPFSTMAAPMVGEEAGPEEPQDVSYSYWPVNYLNGDPTVIVNAPFPLSGVQFSVLARGIGELKASVQLADPEIREMNPWDKFVPRKTGIVVVRTITNQLGQKESTIPFHGILWQAPKDPQTGRMDLTFQTVESLWARRLITGPPPVGMRDPATNNLYPSVTWTGADQAQIVRDLLNPAFFSQVGALGGLFPGWINVEAPVANMGVPRDMTYRRGSATNLLTAHQDRSKIINGYEWFTTLRVLAGTDALSAQSFRCQFVWGYPRLGRQYDGGDAIPRFTYATDGRGNVASIKYHHDGTAVSNLVWGTGAGYDDAALRVYSAYTQDVVNGFLITESTFSNPDVSNQATLQQQTDSRLIQTFANEQYVESVTVRGDLFPYFGTYAIGDDCLFTTDDQTWPDDGNGQRGVTYVSRIMGWKVTPPEGDRSELVDVMLAGREDVDG
jgi:hypothetical protein